MKTTSVERAPQSDGPRVTPQEKIPGENRTASAPRIGEIPPAKGEGPKPGGSDLRHRICEGGVCKEPEPKPAIPESDLRHKICVNGLCTCPAGQTSTKGGCVPTTKTTTQQCAAGESWNGSSCYPTTQCQAGETWDGLRCIPAAFQCANINGRASILVTELRGLRARVQQACSQDPSSSECQEAKQEQSGALQRYQMLLTEANPACRTGLPDPYSL